MRARIRTKFNLDFRRSAFDQITHDALFLAIGLGATNQFKYSDENLAGVIDALDFIEKVKTRDWKSVPLGKTVAVIGAGNTAIDAVTQAKTIGRGKSFAWFTAARKKTFRLTNTNLNWRKKTASNSSGKPRRSRFWAEAENVSALQCEKCRRRRI